jgi:hypothetical protein
MATVNMTATPKTKASLNTSPTPNEVRKKKGRCYVLRLAQYWASSFLWAVNSMVVYGVPFVPQKLVAWYPREKASQRVSIATSCDLDTNSFHTNRIKKFWIPEFCFATFQDTLCVLLLSASAYTNILKITTFTIHICNVASSAAIATRLAKNPHSQFL